MKLTFYWDVDMIAVLLGLEWRDVNDLIADDGDD